MHPDSFRDTILGWCSSHPYWLRHRFRWSAWLGLIPAALVLILTLWQATDPRNWLSLGRNSLTILVGFGLLLAFGLGFLGTTALCARLAAWQLPVRTRQRGESELVPGDVWILVAAVLLGAIGPYFLSKLPGLPIIVRQVFMAFAIFPVIGLLIGMGLPQEPTDAKETDSRRRPQRVWRRPLWLLFIPVAALWGLTLWYDIVRALGDELSRLHAARWLPGYASLAQPFLGTASLLPLLFVLLVIWRNWVRIVPDLPKFASQPNSETPAKSASKSIWSRVWKWLRGLFCPPEFVVAVLAPPSWLDGILVELNDCTSTVGMLQLSAQETSPLSPRTELSHIFGVPIPTVDQVHAFDQFTELFDRCVVSNGSNASAAEVCPDLLVLGNLGSGRTTTLLACAVYAAFVRGQRVLWIVPDSLHEETLRDQIASFLKGLHLQHYVRVESVSAAAVGRWTACVAPVPQVLLATVTAVEEHLYGCRCPADQEERLRRLVLLLGVIVVDDLLDFDDMARSHLPFLLDKQRLLLAAELMPLQVVVSCPRLAVLGEESLGKRLFTVRHFNPQTNVLHLKPRPSARVWQVSLESPDVDATLERLVLASLRRGLDVVLYRRDIDEEERRSQEQRLAALVATGASSAKIATDGIPQGTDRVNSPSEARAGRIAVISDLDRPLPMFSPSDVDAIFYHEAQQSDICLALRLHAGHDETVIFRVVSSSAVLEKPVGLVPLLPDRSASGLLLTHLRSGLRFLRPQVPVPLEIWSRFGLNVLDTSSLTAGMELLPDQLHVDRVDDPDYADLKPYVALHRLGAHSISVNSLGFTHEDWNLYLTNFGTRICIARPEARKASMASSGKPSSGVLSMEHSDVARSRARFARWFDNGAPFHENGDVDLAHAHQFKLIWERRTFGLNTIIQDAEGAVCLISDPWHGKLIDRCLPVWNLHWTVSTGQRGERFWGGPADGLRWFSFQPHHPEVVVRAQIVGQMSEAGETTDLDAIEFDYPAFLSAFIFSPVAIPQQDLAEALGERLQGDWGTGDDVRFASALTAALNYAVRMKIPGWPFFARLVAMQLKKTTADVGTAIAWVIEPTTGGHTASRSLFDLLRQPQDRRELFEAALAVLERLNGAGSFSQKLLRHTARIGFLGDDRIADIAEAIACLKSVRVTSG